MSENMSKKNQKIDKEIESSQTAADDVQVDMPSEEDAPEAAASAPEDGKAGTMPEGRDPDNENGTQAAVPPLPETASSAEKKKKTLLIAAGATILLLAGGCAGKYAYDENTHVLAFNVDPSQPVQILQEETETFDANSLVKESTGDLHITGELDPQNYGKQKIYFHSEKGWSTKDETLDIQVVKKNEIPTIVLKNDIVNVQLGDNIFQLSDVVSSITDDSGKKIKIVDNKIHKKAPGKRDIAFFSGDAFKYDKEGKYVMTLTAYDARGMKGTAKFLLNVTKDKQKADEEIEKIRSNSEDMLDAPDSSDTNTEVREEIVYVDVPAAAISGQSQTSSAQKQQTRTPSSTQKAAGNQQGSAQSQTSQPAAQEKPATSRPKPSGTQTEEPACAAEPAVDNDTYFSTYTEAVRAAGDSYLVETLSDSCRQTIYHLIPLD